MKRLLILLLFLVLAACAPQVQPDYSIVHYNCQTPAADALLLAAKTPGARIYQTQGQSMEPMIYTGDWVTVDHNFPYEGIKPGMIITYQASWLPPTSDTVSHMAAYKYTTGAWVMDGINNKHYESGMQAMTKKHYRGRVIGIFTKRKK